MYNKTNTVIAVYKNTYYSDLSRNVNDYTAGTRTLTDLNEIALDTH